MKALSLRPYFLIVILLFSLGLAACQPIAPAEEAGSGGIEGLVGSWSVETTVVQQNAVFPALLTFTSDGIVLADEPPTSPFETTGHGAWVASGPDTADFTFVALIGSESGALSATIKVAGSLVYDTASDSWSGPFKIWVHDANGQELLADTGTFTGTRIAVETATPADQSLKPGGKIGGMLVTKGPDPIDLNVAPYSAFCNANPMIESGSTVAEPGEYTVACSMPPVPELMIGFGWVTDNQELLDEQWASIHTELYVNGRPVDQAAFGSLDGSVPISGIPGEDPNKVIDVPLRIWNVALQNLQSGEFELRSIWHVDQDLADSMTSTPAGDYEITYRITVDPSMAIVEGAPAPVPLIPEQVSVFDAFNAAVNAHDVDAALAFFADDATAVFPNQPPPNLYTGTSELRAWLENDAKDNIHVEIENAKTAGDTVSAIAKVHVDSLPPDLTLVGAVEVTVENGKITSFRYTLDDETIKKLEALGSQ